MIVASGSDRPAALIRTTAVRSARDYDLLDGGADVLDLALLAARSSAAARRAAASMALDQHDQKSLDSLADLLETSATAIEFFSNAGQAGSRPSGALAARVDVAIDLAIHQSPGPVDNEAVANRLRMWAGEVRSLLADEHSASAAGIADLLAGLAAAVLRATGQPGETTHRL